MSSFRKTISVRQWTNGAYSSGRWVESTYITISILASVQPAQANDISKIIELLPEGRRQSEIYRLYTNTKLNTAQNSKNPDIALLDSVQFEVTAEATWQNNVINHYKYLVTRVKES